MAICISGSGGVVIRLRNRQVRLDDGNVDQRLNAVRHGRLDGELRADINPAVSVLFKTTRSRANFVDGNRGGWWFDLWKKLNLKLNLTFLGFQLEKNKCDWR